MRVLVTGGAGYIGTELVNQLCSKDEIEEILIYDNLSRGNRNLFIGKSKLNAKVKFIQGEILDSRKLIKYLEGVSVVYHLAARVTTPFSDSDSHLFDQVNHWGTANLVDCVKRSKVTRFVYMSSASIYGSQKELINIKTHPNPRSFYGISKLKGEEHARLLNDTQKVFILRCGNVFGYSKSMRFDAVINRFMFDANFKGRLSIQGDGNQQRAFVHINTVIEVLSRLLDDPLSPDTYNLVERNLTINEIAGALKDIYPKLETLHINQHLTLRSIKVDRDARIIDENVRPLNESLREFKNEFTF